MEALSFLNPSKGVEAELTVGDKQENINAQVGDVNNSSTTAEQVGDRVETQNVVNYVQNIPMEFLIIALLGWILPTPTNIGKGLWNGFLIIIGRKKNVER